MPKDDDSDARALNQALVDQLKSDDCIRTPPVEAAFLATLRHLFVPGTPLEQVYSDQGIMVKTNRLGRWTSSSSQPAIMALMLEQLDLQPGHKVLEIGAGTGYNAALMAHMVGETGQVVSIDIDQDLAQAARERLAAAGLSQVQVVCADGGYGYPNAAPFDRIMLTVGAPDVAPAWWEQLAPQGRLVLPLDIKGRQKSIAFERAGDYLTSVSVLGCGFVLLQGDFASQPDPIQLGTEPLLFIQPADEFPLDPDAAYSLLTGYNQDWATNVDLTVRDVFELWTWLALHEPQVCSLVAVGDVMIERGIVPPLTGMGGVWLSVSTIALYEETGLAALMRPPGQAAPLADINKLAADRTPFPLYVRQFGPDESLAQRLLARVQAWDAAGRPATDRMRVRAFSKDSTYAPAAGEFVVQKKWTRLVIDWPT
jgi:protein-L-isoaspartate(D-aspartate) O-methyltransferase